MSRVKEKSGWSKEIIRLVSSTNQTGVTAFESREQHVRFIGSSGIPKGYLVAHATSATQRQGASRALIMAHFTGAARLSQHAFGNRFFYSDANSYAGLHLFYSCHRHRV